MPTVDKSPWRRGGDDFHQVVFDGASWGRWLGISFQAVSAATIRSTAATTAVVCTPEVKASRARCAASAWIATVSLSALRPMGSDSRTCAAIASSKPLGVCSSQR